ncbi:MAG: AMP-binding protein [Chromatiales bacterium]|nr:AMP-binding protein [Chromatiales bacterium]
MKTETLEQNSTATLVSILDEVCATHHSAVAFTNFNSQLSYRELNEKSDAFARYLISHPKINHGDRIAIMMPNLLQYPVVLFGILKAGMIATNINPLYKRNELLHQLKDSGARMIVVIKFAYQLVSDVIPETDIQQVILTGVGDFLTFPKSLLLNIATGGLPTRLVSAGGNAIHLNKALKYGQALHHQLPAIRSDDTALLQYTGGTTGYAKGAMLSHANLVANLNQMEKCFGYLKDSAAKEVIVTALPLYHIFSLTVNCLLFVKLGHQNLLISDPRNIKSLIRTLKKNHFTAITGVSTLFQALVDQPEFSEIDFSRLRAVIGGGMAVHKNTAAAWQKITGTIILQGYGLTETSPVVCVNPPDVKEFNGSVGLPLSATEISIRDGHGKELPIGEHGEVCIRGPQVMQGYWKQTEETAKAIDTQGWFRSGDIGYIGEGGYIYLVERLKNLIIVSGFNVYPSEIEQTLCEHPNIAEAACIGIEDQHSGQRVKAFVVERKSGVLSDTDIIAFCKERLAGYKIPSQIEFRSSLPKSNAGKILHREL